MKLFFKFTFIFRIKNDKSSESLEFWAVHENLFLTPLPEMLRDIQQFVRLTGELVLVDFREFPIGFHNRPEHHTALVKLITSHLGHLMFDRNHTMDASTSGDLSMAEMRDCGRMVLITYNEAKVVKGNVLTSNSSKSFNKVSIVANSMFWTPWKQYSTKRLQTPEYLYYFRKVFVRKDLKNFSWILAAVQSVESAYVR